MTYDEWESQQNLSPISPEACAAEAAWNAALAEARRIVAAAQDAESDCHNLALLLDVELEALQTDYGAEY